jgi:hypothetical protein
MQVRFHHPDDSPVFSRRSCYKKLAVLEAASIRQAIDYCVRADGSASSSSTYLRVSIDVVVLCQMVTSETGGSGGAVHSLHSPRP